ncbi:MAG: hypothetical protein R6V83_14245 [Candidatus Thorarchaeota archaeon]
MGRVKLTARKAFILARSTECFKFAGTAMAILWIIRAVAYLEFPFEDSFPYLGMVLQIEFMQGGTFLIIQLIFAGLFYQLFLSEKQNKIEATLLQQPISKRLLIGTKIVVLSLVILFFEGGLLIQYWLLSVTAVEILSIGFAMMVLHLTSLFLITGIGFLLYVLPGQGIQKMIVHVFMLFLLYIPNAFLGSGSSGLFHFLLPLLSVFLPDAQKSLLDAFLMTNISPSIMPLISSFGFFLTAGLAFSLVIRYTETHGK